MTARSLLTTLAFIAATVVVMLVCTPFRMIADSAILVSVSLMLVALGVSVRGEAMRAESFRMPDIVASKGIYSAVRYPKYLANLLIVWGLTAYTGVVWYMVLMLPLGWALTWWAVISREQRLKNRYEHELYEWRAYTNALIPGSLNFQKSTVKVSWRRMLKLQAGYVMAVALGFCMINLLKNHRLNFEWKLDTPVIIGMAAAALILIISWFVKEEE